MLAIPGIKESTRTLELLELEHVLVGAGEVDALRHAVGPWDAAKGGLEVGAESKRCARTRHDALLIQLACAHFEPRADAEGIVLSTPHSQRGQLHPHAEVRVPAVVAEQVDPVSGADDDVLIAVAIEIGDEHWPGRIVLQWSRQQRAAIVKAATAVVMEQRRALRPRDNEVEPAVIVVIEERRSGRAARARERRRRRAGVAGEGAVAAVVPETCAGGSRDEHVERTVVVIITDCHGAGGLPSPWPEGGCDLGVTPDPIVMEQRIAAILA